MNKKSDISNLPEELLDALDAAVRRRDLAGVDHLLTLCNPREMGVSEALVSASKLGFADMVEKLLPVSDANYRHTAALSAAAFGGFEDCVSLLAPHVDQSSMFSVAMVVVFLPKSLEVISAMVDYMPEEARQIALNAAAQIGKEDCVRFLLNKGVPDYENGRIFASAAQGRNIECVKAMLPLYDPLVNYSWGLRMALKNCDEKMTELLMPVSNVDEARVELIVDGEKTALEFLDYFIQKQALVDSCLKDEVKQASKGMKK